MELQMTFEDIKVQSNIDIPALLAGQDIVRKFKTENRHIWLFAARTAPDEIRFSVDEAGVDKHSRNLLTFNINTDTSLGVATLVERESDFYDDADNSLPALFTALNRKCAHPEM